jgi:hypothetical protein
MTRRQWLILLALVLAWWTITCLAASLARGASARSANFVVDAPTPQWAEVVAARAEQYRRDLARHWLGHELPTWYQPCPIRVQVAPGLGSGGATSFSFGRGEVFGWQMTIQGTPERLLDSVLPHEVNHTIFASHFRCPLPRWADEGACTTVEHESERRKHQRMLVEFLQTGRGIELRRMFALRDYPSDVLPLYSQGHSLADFLLQHAGPQEFVRFVEYLLQSDTESALEAIYHYDAHGLQARWLSWVRAGSPPAPTRVTALQCSSGGCPAPRYEWQGSRGWVPLQPVTPLPPAPLVDVEKPRAPSPAVATTPAPACKSCACDPAQLAALAKALEADRARLSAIASELTQREQQSTIKPTEIQAAVDRLIKSKLAITVANVQRRHGSGWAVGACVLGICTVLIAGRVRRR